MTSLRDRLRVDTAPWHHRVDAAYSTLDLTQVVDLGTFLQAQWSVLHAIECLPGAHAQAAQALCSQTAAALSADLHQLGRSPAGRTSACRLDAAAVLYILLGSRLGTQVLYRRWQKATDPLVLSAGRYLELVPPVGAWRSFCSQLMQQPAQGRDADRIVGDACSLFDLHLNAVPPLAPAPHETIHAA